MGLDQVLRAQVPAYLAKLCFVGRLEYVASKTSNAIGWALKTHNAVALTVGTIT